MAVTITKPEINLREKLKELDFETVPFQKMPSGSVIQVVEESRSTQGQTSSTSFVDTGLEATITLSSDVNKVLVLVHDNARAFSNSGSQRGEYGLFNESDEIITFLFGRRNGGSSGSSSTTFETPVSISALHEPNTITPVTYKTRIRLSSGSAVNWNHFGAKSTITLMEIAG